MIFSAQLNLVMAENKSCLSHELHLVIITFLTPAFRITATWDGVGLVGELGILRKEARICTVHLSSVQTFDFIVRETGIIRQ